MKFSKRIKFALFRLFNTGNNYKCAYCGKSYARFRHTGANSEVFSSHVMSVGGRRKNAVCPNCFSTDRNRLMRLFFEYRTEILKSNTKVLHVSPEVILGRWLRSFETIEYVAGTIEPAPYAELNPIHVDVCQMDFEDDTFDVVIYNHVLEHVDDDRKAMKEIYRVLKPGGFAVLQVPIALDLDETLEDSAIQSPKSRHDAFGQWDHVRLYGLDYFKRLSETGFTVRRDHPVKDNWKLDASKNCLAPNEDVVIAHKG